MQITPLMHNQFQNNKYSTSYQNTNFRGIEKVAQEAAKEVSDKTTKKEGIFVRSLNKLFHLDTHIAQATASLSQTKFSQNLVDWTRKRQKGAARWCDIESIAITFFYMWNTWKSDKVDEERKVPSMIQNGAVTIASSVAAAGVDAAFDPIIDKIGLKYMELEKSNPDIIKQIGGRSAKEFYGAIKKLKSNTVFTAVVRFIIPVMMVPVVGKIVAKLNEKKKEQQEETIENNIQQTVQNQPQPNFVQQNNIKNDDDHDDDHDDVEDNDDHDDDKKVNTIDFSAKNISANNNVNTNSISSANIAYINNANNNESKLETLYA